MRPIDADIFASELDFADADVCEEFPDDYCEFGFSRERIRKLLQDIPTVDAVPVVRCEKCVLHGKCVTEDTFVLAGIENPFCCAGKRKEGAD